MDARVQLDHLAFGVGGTVIRDLTVGSLPSMLGGFANARVLRIARLFRADVLGGYSAATYLEAYSVSGGPGVTLLEDALDLSAYYRYGSLAYRNGSARLTQHGAGAATTYIPGPSFLFTLQGEAVTGDDAQALLVLFTGTWRPRF